MTAARILVAEDHAVTRTLVKRMLTDSGYEVVTTADGDAALAAWEREQPSIVLTDYMMPGIDGPELCRRIRERSAARYTYLIVLTSRLDRRALLTGLQAGADDYVKKPFDRTELLLRVKAGERVVALETALANKIRELEDALERVRTLEGILPICSYCGRIRDEDDTWSDLGVYILRRTKAQFSHGCCPSCAREHLLPQFETPPPALLEFLGDQEHG